MAIESFRSTRRIPSLDGWRAIAVAMVLFSHGAFATSQANETLVHLAANGPFRGEMGVKIFFVLSGFLITRLLLGEEADHGRINWRKFYIRRALRIWPVYFACIAVIAVLNQVQSLGMGWRAFLPSLTFTTGMWGRKESVWLTSHFWSLAVEQQFYLGWPIFLTLVSVRHRILVIALSLLALPLLRSALALWWSFPLSWASITQVDFLLCGGLAAMLWPTIVRFESHARWGFVLGLLTAAGGFVAFNYSKAWGLSARWSEVVHYGPATTALALGLTLVILSTILAPSASFGRFLNSRPLVTMGAISYSIYIWQQLVLNPSAPIQTWWQRFPANTGIALLLGFVSYYGFERWCLRAKRAFAPQTQPATPQPRPVTT